MNVTAIPPNISTKAEMKGRWARLAYSLAGATLLLASCGGPQPDVGESPRAPVSPPLLRVALATSAASFRLGARGGYWISLSDTASPVHSGSELFGALAVAVPGGIMFAGREYRTERILFGPAPGGRVIAEDAAYPGVVEITRLPNGTLMVVNLVDMEDYLVGVLGKEMPLNWPSEALKAQAIAARTYALSQERLKRNAPYHIEATTADQMYGGLSRSSAHAKEIVQATRGMVMTIDGKLFPAYYHSTCGGHTEDALRIFPREVCPDVDLAFMIGVPCSTCAASPHFRWRNEIGAEALAEKLRLFLPRLEAVRALAPLPDGPSGRAAHVRIDDGKHTYTLSVEAVRRALGHQWLKSGWFVVERSGDRFIFQGRGWGHGVGMCQYGARGMAEQGATCADILAHYYRGVELVRLY